MSPITHFIGSWLVAAAVTDNPRDRRLVTLAGVMPDVDGLGMVVDVAKSLITGQETMFAYYHRFHHLWLHGWPGALVVVAGLAWFARHRWRVVAGCLITFHLHLLCDLLGSRGPSPADLWPICYSEPLFRNPVWFWKGQWRLDGWQNTSIFVIVFMLALWVAVKRGHSFVGVFSQHADAVFVRVLRKWRDQLRASRTSP
jgi:inner membrane protein